MKYEYYYGYFMNTFMNTFLRGMNTMDTLRTFTLFLIKIYSNIRSIVSILECVYTKTIHSIHQQIETIHQSIHKPFTKYSFLEVD